MISNNSKNQQQVISKENPTIEDVMEEQTLRGLFGVLLFYPSDCYISNTIIIIRFINVIVIIFYLLQTVSRIRYYI